MAGGTKALEKVKGMYIRFAPLFQMFALAYHFRISIYDAKLYTPSTLNIVLIQWHTHLNVCAVK